MKSVATDAIDDVIVGALRENGRLSFTELGRRAGLSPHAAASRVRRLEEAGVIVGYEAIVDDDTAAGSIGALIDVRLLATTPPERFEAFLETLPDVRQAWFVTGRFDYVLRISCADTEAMDRTVRAIRLQGGVAATESRMVMRARRPHSGLEG